MENVFFFLNTLYTCAKIIIAKKSLKQKHGRNGKREQATLKFWVCDAKLISAFLKKRNPLSMARFEWGVQFWGKYDLGCSILGYPV